MSVLIVVCGFGVACFLHLAGIVEHSAYFFLMGLATFVVANTVSLAQ